MQRIVLSLIFSLFFIFQSIAQNDGLLTLNYTSLEQLIAEKPFDEIQQPVNAYTIKSFNYQSQLAETPQKWQQAVYKFQISKAYFSMKHYAYLKFHLDALTEMIDWLRKINEQKISLGEIDKPTYLERQNYLASFTLSAQENNTRILQYGNTIKLQLHLSDDILPDSHELEKLEKPADNIQLTGILHMRADQIFYELRDLNNRMNYYEKTVLTNIIQLKALYEMRKNKEEDDPDKYIRHLIEIYKKHEAYSRLVMEYNIIICELNFINEL